MTTWPDVVEAAAKFSDYGSGERAGEIRMSESTLEVLVDLSRSNLSDPPERVSGVQSQIFGVPIVLDESLAGTRWEMRARDGAVIKSGELTREQRAVIADPGT